MIKIMFLFYDYNDYFFCNVYCVFLIFMMLRSIWVLGVEKIFYICFKLLNMLLEFRMIVNVFVKIKFKLIKL